MFFFVVERPEFKKTILGPVCFTSSLGKISIIFCITVSALFLSPVLKSHTYRVLNGSFYFKEVMNA